MRMTFDIATWNRQTIVRMDAAHQLYVPARTLTGDQVTDVDNLVAAKLTARLAPAPAGITETAIHLYQPVAPADTSAVTGAEGLILRATPKEALARPERGPEPIARTW